MWKRTSNYALTHESGKYKIAKYGSSPHYMLWRVGDNPTIVDKGDIVEPLKTKAENLAKQNKV